MKKFYLLVLLLLLMPIVSAEMNKQFIENSFENNRKLIINDLNNRDKNIQIQIDEKFEAFKDNIKYQFSLYLLKFGIVLITSIFLALMFFYSFVYYIKKLRGKIEK